MAGLLFCQVNFMRLARPLAMARLRHATLASLAGVTLGWSGVVLAGGEAAAPKVRDISLPHCQSMVEQLYGQRLPLRVDASLERRQVHCGPGLARQTAIWHTDVLTVPLPPEEHVKVLASMRRRGADNRLVQALCQSPAHREVLRYVDLVFAFHGPEGLLATVDVSLDHCLQEKS